MCSLVLLIALLAAGPAAAQVASERPDAVAVALYRERGVAAITETRTVDLPAGRSRVSFRNVADEIVPQTAILEGLPGPQVERNYDFDLLSPGALLDKAVGERARLVRTNPRKGGVKETPVTIRSGADGVVLQTEDGRTEALHCSGLPEKLVFDRAPPGLTASPTLSATVNTPRAGRYTLTLSYLAEGLSWSANYVAQVRPDGHGLDLTGWLTLSNRGSTSFGDAPTQVVAGTLNWSGNDQRPAEVITRVDHGCWPVGHGRFAAPPSHIPYPPPPPPAPMTIPMARLRGLQEVVVTASRKLATVSDLGDYKLYTLPEPTTVAARQTKQVAFLEREAVPFDRVYVFAAHAKSDLGADETLTARAVIRMQNVKDHGLGEPLPAGQAAVYETGPGERLFFTGRAPVKDTPVGMPAEMDAGAAPQVTLRSRPTANSVRMQNGVKVVDSRMDLTFANAGQTSAYVEYKMPLNGRRILEESGAHDMKDGGAVWAVKVPPGERRTLTVSVEARG